MKLSCSELNVFYSHLLKHQPSFTIHLSTLLTRYSLPFLSICNSIHSFHSLWRVHLFSIDFWSRFNQTLFYYLSSSELSKLLVVLPDGWTIVLRLNFVKIYFFKYFLIFFIYHLLMFHLASNAIAYQLNCVIVESRVEMTCRSVQARWTVACSRASCTSRWKMQLRRRRKHTCTCNTCAI